MWARHFFFVVERFSLEGDSHDFYHVCTDGASLDWMFRDDSDFIAGVNRIGICKILSGVKVVSFVLMDNHVHFVLKGEMFLCKEFIVKFKNLTSKYISSRYGIYAHTHSLPTEIIRIDTPDRLIATLAYIDRNPIVAGWRRMPDEYLWGVARFLFREFENRDNLRSLVSFPVREQRRLLRTHHKLPQDWLVDERGMLCPSCFVDIDFLEKLFRTPGRYLYFLSKKLEGEIDKSVAMGIRTFLQDKDLRAIVRKLTVELFGEDDVRLLSVNSRLVLARKLRYDYASSVKQIARMLHIDAQLLKGFI